MTFFYFSLTYRIPVLSVACVPLVSTTCKRTTWQLTSWDWATRTLIVPTTIIKHNLPITSPLFPRRKSTHTLPLIHFSHLLRLLQQLPILTPLWGKLRVRKPSKTENGKMTKKFCQAENRPPLKVVLKSCVMNGLERWDNNLPIVAEGI